MKFLISLSFLVLSLTPYSQNQSLQFYNKYFSKGLKDWSRTFTNFNLEDFTKRDSKHFENNFEQNLGELKSFYAIYKPIVCFNKDSSKFIDIYSYQMNLEKKKTYYQANPDVDQVIFLCDLKKKFWNRIYFLGISGWIEEVYWISNSKFILAGIMKNDKNQNTPLIIIGDSTTEILNIFRDKNSNCVQNSKGYVSPKLKRIRIKGL